MTVYVVMGNDFPAGVFSTQALADAYCESQKAEDAKRGARIYWRVYEYELDAGE